MKEIYARLNKVFESRVRLGIMSALVVNTAMDFKALKDLLDLTDGNLASSLKVLEREGYVNEKKQFIGKKPNTRYSCTASGRKAFSDHLDVLEKLINMKK
ncbi:MAG TPA: transcriptional regulator [Cyclobacteriaceae bacterium]|nr:transcriptional regulator [Cyclobacteriaceae bacterium]